MKLCPYCHNPLSDADVDQLQAENAKLRDLVRDMWKGAVTRMDFAERYSFVSEFADRIRELEVDA